MRKLGKAVLASTLMVIAGGVFVYSQMPDESYKVKLDDGRNGTIRRWKVDNLTSLSLNGADYYIIDNDGDLNADNRSRIVCGGSDQLCNPRYEPVSGSDIETFKEAVDKSGIRK